MWYWLLDDKITHSVKLYSFISSKRGLILSSSIISLYCGWGRALGLRGLDWALNKVFLVVFLLLPNSYCHFLSWKIRKKEAEVREVKEKENKVEDVVFTGIVFSCLNLWYPLKFCLPYCREFSLVCLLLLLLFLFIGLLLVLFINAAQHEWIKSSYLMNQWMVPEFRYSKKPSRNLSSCYIVES